MLADKLQLRAALPEHRLAAPHAGVVQGGLGRLGEVILEVIDHAQQVAARAFLVAPAKQHRRAFIDVVADGNKLVLRIDANQVAHLVVVPAAGRLGARHHQADKGVARGLPQALEIALQFGQHDVKRRAIVQRDDDVAFSLRHHMPATHRRATLRQA